MIKSNQHSDNPEDTGHDRRQILQMIAGGLVLGGVYGGADIVQKLRMSARKITPQAVIDLIPSELQERLVTSTDDFHDCVRELLGFINGIADKDLNELFRSGANLVEDRGYRFVRLTAGYSLLLVSREDKQIFIDTTAISRWGGQALAGSNSRIVALLVAIGGGLAQLSALCEPIQLPDEHLPEFRGVGGPRDINEAAATVVSVLLVERMLSKSLGDADFDLWHLYGESELSAKDIGRRYVEDAIESNSEYLFGNCSGLDLLKISSHTADLVRRLMTSLKFDTKGVGRLSHF